MRKYGKWVLTLSMLASTSELTFAAETRTMEKTPSSGNRAPRIDNQRVADNIANALRGKVSADLGISYKDGVAEISGTVSDPKLKALATSIVERVPNVSKVDNRISVVEKKRTLLDHTKNKSSTDKNIVQAGHHSGHLTRQTIQQVSDSVPSDATQDSAAEAPQINLPSLGEPAIPAPSRGPSNQDVAEQIGAAVRGAGLEDRDIEIRYSNGMATLEGSVANPMERAAAYRAVSSVPGVRSVANRLMCASDPMAQSSYAGGRVPNGYAPPRGDIRSTGYMQSQNPGGMPGQQMPQPPAPGPGYPGSYPNGPGMDGGAPGYPPAYGYQGSGASQAVYNSPSMPDHAWPTYAQYPNSAAVTYPQQYSASAWPYIGPFYPYPQVPLGWRDATLRWDDGQWNLMFKPRTDRWWWFLNPNNW